MSKIQVINMAKMHILKNDSFLIAYIYRNLFTDEWSISVNEPKNLPKSKYEEYKAISLKDIKNINKAS